MKRTVLIASLFFLAPAGHAVSDRLSQSLISDGIGYAQTKDYENALKAFNLAVERDPESSVAIYNRGIVYYRVDDLPAAVKDFEAACSMGNDGACALVKQLDKADRQRRGKASELLEQASRLNADGKPDEALSLLGDALSADPSIPQVYYLEAEIYFRSKKDTDAAIGALDSALKYDPQYAEALCLRGMIYTEIRRYRKAAPDLKKAAEISPGLPQVHAALGDLHMAKKDYADAVASYVKSLDLNDSQPDVHYSCGLAYKKVKDPKNAYRQFARACKLQYRQACGEAAALSSAVASAIAQDVYEQLDKA
ncbi:MAG: tetratricopeptide repeat protein, partial [Elusimicrobiaceae bacterium]|nr:tetratricopeptide repeat protein [Elusimicrobiaceae bacterium]